MEVPLLGVWCWFVICMAERASLLFGLAAFEKETESGWGHWSAGAVYSQWVFVCPAPLTTAIVFCPFNPQRVAVNKHICHWGFLRSVGSGQDVFTYHSLWSVWPEFELCIAVTLNQIYRMCSYGEAIGLDLNKNNPLDLINAKSTIASQEFVLCLYLLFTSSIGGCWCSQSKQNKSECYYLHINRLQNVFLLT